MSDPLKQPTDGGGDSEDPGQVVAEHGPANEVHMMHDHAAGMHTVDSVHEDGHAHHSEHGSAGEAHDHAKRLSEPAADGGQSTGDEPEYE